MTIRVDIYIKPVKKLQISKVKVLKLGKLAEVLTHPDIQKQVEELPVLYITEPKTKKYLVSDMDLVRIISETFPGNTVINLGEMDTLVEYSPKEPKERKAWKWLKVAFVSVVLFMGSATAIMSFHNDSEIHKVFQNYYYMVFGEQTQHPRIIEIPYAIGVATGIIVFFNHVMGKKITNDPTPVQVETAKYETEVDDVLIDSLSKEGMRVDDGGSG